jgi:hypothetical protein
MNKRGGLPFMVVLILVSLVSFGVIVNYFLSTNDIISSSFDDLQCNQLMKFKGSDIYEITDFFYQINTRCKVDQISINKDYSKNDFYNKIADSSVSCFDRYGKGEYDFLEKYNANGNWCFLCAKVDIEERSENFEEFFDFITWTKENKVNETSTYYDYTNYVYFDPSNENLQKVDELNLEVNEIINQVVGETPEFEDISLYMLEEYQTLIDYQLKNFDIEDTYYITYRFTRVDKNTQEQFEDLMINTRNAVIGGVVASIGAEIAIGATVGAVAGQVCNVVPVVGGFVCGVGGGIIGGVVGGIKGLISVGSQGSKAIIKIARVIKKINILKHFSKKAKVTNVLDDVIEVSFKSGKKVNVPKIIESKNIIPEDLNMLSEILRADNKFPDEVIHLEKLEDFMKINNLNNLEKINDYNPNFINYLEDISSFSPSSKIDNLNPQIIKPLNDLKPDLVNTIDNLKSGKQLDIDDKKVIVTYTKLFVIALGVGVGIAYEDNLDDSNQYVDIMTKEEFYRQCGFPPGTTATN